MSLEVNISEPDEFNNSELHKCIKEVAKIKGVDAFEYHVEFVSGKGEHFIANIFRVHIKDTEKKDNISVIVKTLVNTTRQELFRELHKREVLVYEEVLPLFDKIQIGLEDERVILPKCIFSSVEVDKEILILEDLLAQGFAMDNKLKNFGKLDYLQVRLVLTELAKFHALSFVCKAKDTENFMKIKSKFDDIIYQESFLNKGKLQNYFPECYQMSLKVVHDEEAKSQLEKIEDKIVSMLRKFVEPRKCNVLCHGDCWINNVLFKHQEMKQSQICFLDFQAMRYASPATDIIYFLYLCTDSTFRSEHFETLKCIYYQSLKSALRIYDINVNEFYPKEEYEKDITDYLPFGLLIAILDLRLIITNGYDDTKLKGTNFGSVLDLTEELDNPELFELAINDVVNESVKNGVLDQLVSEINNLD